MEKGFFDMLLKIHGLSEEELFKRRGDIFTKLLCLGVEEEDLLEMNAITTETTIRKMLCKGD